MDLASLPWPCTATERPSQHGASAATAIAGQRIEVAQGQTAANNSTGAAHLALSAVFKKAPKGQRAFSVASVSGRALLAKDSAECDSTPAADWADVNGGVAARDRRKGAVTALLRDGDATRKTDNGLVIVVKSAWQRAYDQRTKSMRCGGAHSRVHESFDGAWQVAPSDPAPPEEKQWSESLRCSEHGELNRLYGSDSARPSVDVQNHPTQQTGSTELDLYDEICSLYGKQSQKDNGGNAGLGNAESGHQPAQRKKQLSDKSLKVTNNVLLGVEKSVPMCLCGSGRRRLEVLSQEQNALKQCARAQRIALQQAHDAMALPSERASDRSRIKKTMPR
eukprot:gnl/MRDRNA2_/MRDRNA2_95625_c0_seq1.p1 gnl/MRDRNA2_/MRDRNA2_95625_c0~~gnl/MRDRNA2_/MRDRNA2_95625_c0_seq1.p1  ORF type:complete len:336 (+),score=77.73 gnl/MRDRNA2_/MRDRNA2_95625_c0_seq1:74-1081(+)